MSEKTSLKAMRCPTCGGSLKAENDKDAIICVYCGNTIVPVSEITTVTEGEAFGQFNGVLRVEGIKTPSSALAYLELIFDEYDWESFAYAQTVSIKEIDNLANSLKATSADDKNTWFVCFNAIAVPYLKKIDGCKRLLDSVIEEYRKDNLDAYSKFDAYKRISSVISNSKNEVTANLEKVLANAARYGASKVEIKALESKVDEVKLASDFSAYSEIEEIPQIKSFIEEKNVKIVTQLASQGIDAENEYNRAKMLIDEKKFVEALNVLSTLRGYSDSNTLIEKIDKYYLISDVLEIEGTLYYFSKSGSGNDTFDLHTTANGKISEKVVISDIKKIITNYADVLYYLDGDRRLRRFSLSKNLEEKILDENSKHFVRALQKKEIYIYNRRAFLVFKKSDNHGDVKSNVVELDLTKGSVKTVLKNIEKIISLTGNKMIYTVSKRKDNADSDSDTEILTSIVNVDTMDTVELGAKKITVEGFIDNNVVYTQMSPNDFNKNLYIKSFDADKAEVLIEQNIYRFCDIIANKLFYYVGNSRNQSLININCDGTGRREWPLYISNLLFEQGGWIYFIRKIGYNAILCKSRINGKKYSIIANGIDQFVEIKNGYLYYINDASTLVKVRMDGSNSQELCEDVEKVLAVKEDKIIFVSVDGRIKTGEGELVTEKIVKSIYAVDFTGSGKIKLAYNIKNAEKYAENTVYYIAAKEIKSSYTQLEKRRDVLYSLDVETNNSEKLLELQIEESERESNGFAIAMIAMVFTFIFGIAFFAGNEPGLGVMGILGGIISLLIGVAIKGNKKE